MEESKNLMQVGHPDELNQVDESRRRWTKAGLGAGAVLATLAGRPAFAGICQSPSAFSSGNMSHHGTTQDCEGYAPDVWADLNQNQYPVQDEKFTKVFPNLGKVVWDNEKLSEVMSASDNENAYPKPNPISKEFAAAYLNINKGWYPAGLDETRLMMMWNEYASSGEYEVRANVFWKADQIVAYLKYMRTPVVPAL